ncbi:TMhelix containing protein [Vibrio phage 1.139.A._10N.261.48.C6]|nr:TMhelix containing protein [Vibrio phage 1.034.O._10N.261.46.B7]AUR83492.1 TMhelix containing protein [Vibrio phage 1.034.X._10N.261.46.B7]AUR90230.1 TMhelix containing protein [Vibrio phage 1.139.A._10N.261.48.C6]AUR90298.1 TMhelix containing protein [Vibrio phage 1.139.B._10N.261.48.C6]
MFNSNAEYIIGAILIALFLLVGVPELLEGIHVYIEQNVFAPLDNIK